MNTKTIMTLSAVALGVAGLLLTFIPDIILGHLNIATHMVTLLVLQILGALYFAFGMLNWMIKSGLIGGIYNRPIAIANFTHFLIAGLALIKGLFSNPNLPNTIWITGVIYFVFAILFGIILFRSPVSGPKPEM